MNRIVKMIVATAFGALLAGCLSPAVDNEGFVAYDGTMAQTAPSDYFILRFERPDGVCERGWNRGQTRWVFTEVRQLRDGTTMVADGELSTPTRKVAPHNWAKWIRPGSRNVRVKFVGADYTLAEAGREAVPEGFTPLFADGKGFDGWQGVMREEDSKGPEWRRALDPMTFEKKQAEADACMRAHWSLRDGAVFFDGKKGGTSIATKKDYHNFELLVDWRLLRVYGDSGFYLRAMSQVQIWDPNAWGGQGSGGLWNNGSAFFGATSRADRPIGDWNRFRIRMVGDRVSVWLNGVNVVDAVPLENCLDTRMPIPFRENIQLQCHGDPIEFRNVFIRELPDEPVSATIPAVRVGACSWSWGLPMREVVAQMEANGISGVNLALMPFIENDKYHGGSESAETWQWLKEKVARGDIAVMSTMISTVGEDYTTIETIRRTGGIVPDAHWEANMVRFEKGAALTKELGCKYLLTHAGFLDESNPKAFSNYLARVLWIRDTCAKNDVTLILETGQETADALVSFLQYVPGVFVNFDPANMILYAKGEPMAAVRKLYPWIMQVHVKDGCLAKKSGEWGEEVPWGMGEVGGRRFIEELERLGFKGNYVIEREGGKNRVADIVMAKDRLTAGR